MVNPARAIRPRASETLFSVSNRTSLPRIADNPLAICVRIDDRCLNRELKRKLGPKSKLLLVHKDAEKLAGEVRRVVT
ncbi:MAG: hypothetical protein EB117_17775 [Betaproteobacteria bacterium]|nr:hypothetical protein [Betaproteobacteria bacterium]